MYKMFKIRSLPNYRENFTSLHSFNLTYIKCVSTHLQKLENWKCNQFQIAPCMRVKPQNLSHHVIADMAKLTDMVFFCSNYYPSPTILPTPPSDNINVIHAGYYSSILPLASGMHGQPMPSRYLFAAYL